jgi:hypothetical protein
MIVRMPMQGDLQMEFLATVLNACEAKNSMQHIVIR